MQAVIFDMDGVILDSERYLHIAWQRVAEEMGLGDIEEMFRMTLGWSDAEIIKLFYKTYGYDGFLEFHDRCYDWAHQHVPDGIIPLREGALELLQALKEKGIPIGLASASYKDKVIQELKDAGGLEYFDTIWAGDMVEHCKPDPALFLGACADLKVDPAQCFGVEDGPNGIRAIHAAGMRAILAEDQYHPTQEIADLCEVIVPTLGEVQDYIFANWGGL